MNSFKQGISSPPPPKKSVQFWAFQLNLRFCLKNSRRTDPHSRMSDMCKKTTLPVSENLAGFLPDISSKKYNFKILKCIVFVQFGGGDLFLPIARTYYFQNLGVGIASFLSIFVNFCYFEILGVGIARSA